MKLCEEVNPDNPERAGRLLSDPVVLCLSFDACICKLSGLHGKICHKESTRTSCKTRYAKSVGGGIAPCAY